MISCVYLIHYVRNILVVSVGENNDTFFFEFIYILFHSAVKEDVLLKCRLINHYLNALCLYALHNALYRRLAEIITLRFHRKAIYADLFRVHCNYSLGNKILTRSVCGNNRRNYDIRHVIFSAASLKRAVNLSAAGRIFRFNPTK